VNLTGIDDLKCAGCGEPLPVDAETTQFRLYNGESGLLVADITCRCGALNYLTMPGMADEVKRGGYTVYQLNREPPQALYDAAAQAGVPVMSICGADGLPGLTMFVQGEEDPALARKLVVAWAEGLNLEAVLGEFAPA
jgi:hypothetical protein